jgi:hypothetical protein
LAKTALWAVKALAQGSKFWQKIDCESEAKNPFLRKMRKFNRIFCSEQNKLSEIFRVIQFGAFLNTFLLTLPRQGDDFPVPAKVRQILRLF